MTASRNRRLARSRVCLGGALLVALASGCATAPTPAAGGIFDSPTRAAARPPDSADRFAARFAAAALAVPDARPAGGETLDEPFERFAEAARERLETLGRDARDDEDPKRLTALVLDVRNATVADPIAYRVASGELLESSLLNPAHRARLQRAVDDDPKRLASRRVRDHWESYWAQTFNAVAQSFGQNLLFGVALAPYTAASTGVHYIATWFERPPLSVQQRQALAHWKTYVALHPDAADADETRERIAEMQPRLDAARSTVLVDGGEGILERGDGAYAERLALQALAIRPDDVDATNLHGLAGARSAQLDTHRRTSLATDADPNEIRAETAPTVRALLHALLLPGEAARINEAAQALVQASDTQRELASLRDEAEFANALAQHELGFEDESWAALDALASRDPEASNMARHAAVLVLSADQNPYGAFRVQLSQAGRNRFGHRLIGPWAQRPRYRSLPTPVSYTLDAPAVFYSALTAPLRLLFEPVQAQPDFAKPASLAAYRYLARNPDGAHASELLLWLLDYEEDRDNAAGALRIADFVPDLPTERRDELLEQAAEQRLQRVANIDRPDQVQGLLRSVVREYPESEAGRSAGLQAREHAIRNRPQRIRLTRGFLDENPRIWSRSGLALRGELLDGELHNGELHPRGVSFIGGRLIELELLAESGKEEDEPIRIEHKVSRTQLARSVALLDEATTLGARLDPDDIHAPDAQRDLYLERARLGLTDEVDQRPSAHSSYVYRGMREQYGVVRGRDSLLPFDLVLRGSLQTLSLGAFPRWRQPQMTPDAFLYR